MWFVLAGEFQGRVMTVEIKRPTEEMCSVEEGLSFLLHSSRWENWKLCICTDGCTLTGISVVPSYPL